jgi:hypothetical protein
MFVHRAMIITVHGLDGVELASPFFVMLSTNVGTYTYCCEIGLWDGPRCAGTVPWRETESSCACAENLRVGCWQDSKRTHVQDSVWPQKCILKCINGVYWCVRVCTGAIIQHWWQKRKIRTHLRVQVNESTCQSASRDDTCVTNSNTRV